MIKMLKSHKDIFIFVIAVICEIISVIIVIFYADNIIINNIASILQNVFVGLLVSGLFIRYMEKQEKDIFRREIINIQKETAQDAIKSLFTRLINKKTFEMIQKDIFQGKFVRKNVTWDYTITKNHNGQMVLKRVISYILKNITLETQKETFNVFSDNTGIHCTFTTNTSIGYDGKLKPIDENNKEIEIRPKEELEVITEMTEVFNDKLDYIYATHSPRFGIVGLRLNVNFPKDYIFKIVVSKAFSNELEKIHESDGKHIYETKKAIYKGQAIEFVCYPKKYEEEKINEK